MKILLNKGIITLNMKSAEQAVNDFMMMFTGLYKPEVKLRHQLKFVPELTLVNIEPRANQDCFDCSNSERSRRGKGFMPQAFSLLNVPKIVLQKSLQGNSNKY